MAYPKEELEKKTMKELREIGKPLGARDTDKAELIREIMLKQEPLGDVKGLIAEIEQRKGDMVRTYELREIILAVLKKIDKEG